METFGMFKEPKNIIELFTFDLTTFFYEDDYEEIACVENDGVFMIEFEKMLPWTELGIFNTIIFRLFNEKRNVIGSRHINVRLTAEINDKSKKSIIKIVNKLNIIYGSDDDNTSEWTTNDDASLYSSTFNRQWTLGDGNKIYTIRLFAQKNTIILTILFFNHLVEHIKD